MGLFSYIKCRDRVLGSILYRNAFCNIHNYTEGFHDLGNGAETNLYLFEYSCHKCCNLEEGLHDYENVVSNRHFLRICCHKIYNDIECFIILEIMWCFRIRLNF